jgi:hypothetical protein
MKGITMAKSMGKKGTICGPNSGYVEHHITPHGLRVMALRSWRTLICHLEAPKGQSNQSGLRDFKR